MNDGGPVYPSGDQNWKGEPGMMLRDWFAGQALNGLLSDVDCICGHPETNKGPANHKEAAAFTAYQAYLFADAMLKARES